MQLPNPVQYAIPAFIFFVVAEVVMVRFRVLRGHYEFRDSSANLLMGFGNFGFGLLTGGIVFASMKWAHQFAIFDIGYAWWAFVAALFLEDLVYYWFHRLSHERRIWWVAHVNHHSSQHLNLSTALRQTWTSFLVGTFALWLPLCALGFPAELIVFHKGVNLVFQFFVHTEAIRRLPRPIEFVFNTPSHHRVHHAMNPRYLDRNYAGIFIIWDRMFGTFVPELDDEPCRYGLVKQIGSFNPVRIALHEWWSMLRDALGARRLRDALMYLFGPPGWSPDGSRKTSAQIRAEAVSAKSRRL